jgi:hypothetical protein
MIVKCGREATCIWDVSFGNVDLLGVMENRIESIESNQESNEESIHNPCTGPRLLIPLTLVREFERFLKNVPFPKANNFVNAFTK